MKSGRSDIEKMLALWLDGKLDAEQAEQLMSFLENQPDLQDDIPSLSHLKLNPPKLQYNQKEKLIKSPADISAGQFEYLSVAALENDLSDQGKKELEEIIEKDQSRKQIYESIKKTKLKPPEYVYPSKNRLIKPAIAQKVWRISLTAISAAAALALLVTYLKPAFLLQNGNSTSRAQITSVSDTLIIYSTKPVVNSTLSSGNDFRKKEPRIRMNRMPSYSSLLASELKGTDAEKNSGINFSADVKIEPVVAETRYLRIPGLVEKRHDYSALAAFPERLKPPVFEKNRSNVDRFIAKLIHNKILKDTLSIDRPVKGYDIAEAGIVSINKLLGWDMALVRTSDEDGEPKSVYFSSAILKFNVPVKKSSSDE